MATFACSYLGSEVELTEEREKHIAENHPDLLPEHRDKIVGTLAEPDEVRRSTLFAGARLFSKWYGGLRGGKFVVVVVVAEKRRKGVGSLFVDRTGLVAIDATVKCRDVLVLQLVA
jgi:hypothetical protein